MPSRRLPRTDEERDEALRNGKNRKDAIPAPLVIPYTATTISRLDALQPVYRGKFIAVSNAKNAQTTISATVNEARKQGIYLVHDFIEAMNRAIRRKLFLPTVRNLYQIDVNDDTLPQINTESELKTWGENLADGEAARIAAGGVPITFPSIAEVTAAIAAFNNANNLQANAKDAYDIAQEDLAAENIEADKLILKMWNETETAFDEGDKSSTRRKAREWGVVYTINPGETLDPNEFSMTGRITDLVTGNAIDDVIVRLDESNTFVVTDPQGYYYMPFQPTGSYTVQVVKNGYDMEETPNVNLVAGQVITFNAQLTPSATSGTISGLVTAAGNPAQALLTVVAGSGTYTTHTMPDGTFNMLDVPAGLQTITAELDGNPAATQSQQVTVPAAGTVTANFIFP